LAWNNPSSTYDDIAIEVEHVVNDSIEEDLLAQENLSQLYGYCVGSPISNDIDHEDDPIRRFAKTQLYEVSDNSQLSTMLLLLMCKQSMNGMTQTSLHYCMNITKLTNLFVLIYVTFLP
jgi:hypothetical protein